MSGSAKTMTLDWRRLSAFNLKIIHPHKYLEEKPENVFQQGVSGGEEQEMMTPGTQVSQNHFLKA